MEALGLQALHRRVAGIAVHRMLHVVTALIEQPDGTMQRQTREFGGFKRDCRVSHDSESEKRKKRGRAPNATKFDLRTRLFQLFEVDLTRIDGIDVTTALAVISERGADMSRFPSVAHFAILLGLCPGTKITGGKVMSGKTKRCANRAAQALRLAASALRTSQ
jgi:hypothetical protein